MGLRFEILEPSTKNQVWRIKDEESKRQEIKRLEILDLKFLEP